MTETYCGYNSNNIHDFDTVKTNGKLNIGILNAFKGVFDLGVKYTKEIIITVTTAEMMIMVDVGMGAFEKVVNKVSTIKELQPFGDFIFKLVDYKLKFLDSDLEIVKYMGYEYLSRSYKEYLEAIKNTNASTPTSLNHQEQFDNFLKTFSSPIQNPTTQLTNHIIPKQSKNQQQHTVKRGGGNINYESDKDALKIADRIIGQVLLLPLHLQLNELVKIIDKIRNIAKTKPMSGGGIKKSKKRMHYKRRKYINKTKRMIYNSLMIN